MKISVIAALGRNRALGKEGNLIWKIPDDLKRFKYLTTGHPIIMGLKTFESIGRPLPNRTNIVLTRNVSWRHEGVIVVHSLGEALDAVRETGADEVFVIGGGDVYRQALPFADTLYLTLIDAEAEADTFFPEYESSFTHIVKEEDHTFGDLRYRWINLKRWLKHNPGA